jgi:hypothetical protein
MSNIGQLSKLILLSRSFPLVASLTGSFCTYHWQIEAPLPQNTSGFRGNRNTSTTRYHPRCKVRRWSGCCHPRAISETVSGTCQLTNAFHLLPNRAVIIDSVGKKLYLNSAGDGRFYRAVNIDLVGKALESRLYWNCSAGDLTYRCRSKGRSRKNRFSSG